MDTIRKQVPIEEIPESWRDGLGDAEMVSVTLEAVPSQTTDVLRRRDILEEVAGLWADRTDLDDLYREMRETSAAKFDHLLSRE